MRLPYSGDTLFTLGLTLSVGLHFGLAAWVAWLRENTPPEALPLRRAATTVSLRRTTVRPEEVVARVQRRDAPLPELPRETKLDSPVKRLASAVSRPRPPEFDPRPPRTATPEPLETARREEPDRTEPTREPPRKRSAPPPAVPVPDVEIGEQEQEASSASAGELVEPAGVKTNPKIPFPLAHRDAIDSGLQLMVLVGSDGRAKSFEVLDSSGVTAVDREHGEFILAHWEFVPAKRGGRPTDGLYPVQVNFRRR